MSVSAGREAGREGGRGGGGGGGESGREGVGGGQRTKETNLNEMTCFGGVKSGELGFSVPSPRRHIHLERPDLRVYTPEHINRHTEQMGRVKKIGGAKKKKKSERERQGSSLIICRQQASLFFERQKHILNSSRALKVCYLKGISLKATTTRISMSVKVKTELTLLAFERKKKGGYGAQGGLVGIAEEEGRGRGLVEAGHTVPPGSACLVKHSCHFVHLEVGLLAQVEKWKRGGDERV